MKKVLILIFILFYLTGKSQMCNTAPTLVGALTPTATWQNAAANSGAKRYWTFNATAGCTYNFSSCNGTNTNDTYLRLYSGTNPTTAVLQTSNDDNGPWCTSTKASLTWTCPTTGAYSILLTDWSCANLSQNSTLSYRGTCPPNPCTTIPTITCGTNISLTIASGSGVYNPPATSCGFTTPGIEQIYSFTPSVTGNYQISLPTSFGYIDFFYKAASGGCSGTGWTCIDDITNANVGNAGVNIALTAGTQYYILLDPESTTGGSVVWSLKCPTNDNCGNAIAITSLPYTSPVTSNVGSTDDVPTSASGCGTQGSNLWYTVVGNGDNLTATTCNASTNFDTEVRVYTGSCSSLNSMVEVVCNDDDGKCASSGLQSTVTWCSTSGATYLISVGYYASGVGTGNFVLSVTDVGACSVLPIKLLNFEGHNEIDYNKLTWKTATETSNRYFTLERSTDGQNWIQAGIVAGAGTSLVSRSYEYKDYNYVRETINYYRLSQTDLNGDREYFSIIEIDANKVSKCTYEYFDLLGNAVNIDEVPSGIYLRKCGSKIEKIVKAN